MMSMLPTSRGFNTSLGYQGAYEDHYTQQAGGGKKSSFGCAGVDLWHNETPAYGYNGTYGDKIYSDEMERVIRVHHAHHRKNPFFMYLALQILHGPQQVPDHFAAYFRERGFSEEYALYNGMGSMADEILGNLTSILHEVDMYDNTLIIVLSDNGGPAGRLGKKTSSCGANNWPLRGGKTNFFEGGVRSIAFVSGGFVPLSARGSIRDGYMHLCDWYSTLAWLAGIGASDNFTTGYPDIDGFNMWPYMIGDVKESPRIEIMLGSRPASSRSGGGIINRSWKYIRGSQSYADWWAPIHPNTSTEYTSIVNDNFECGIGCLFNIRVRVCFVYLLQNYHRHPIFC